MTRQRAFKPFCIGLIRLDQGGPVEKPVESFASEPRALAPPFLPEHLAQRISARLSS